MDEIGDSVGQAASVAGAWTTGMAARTTGTAAAASTAANTGTAIGASQIDTTVVLSQGTLNDLFGSSSEPEELSQAAVPRAFGLSHRDFNTEASQREVADVNYIPDDEGEKDYESMDSGGESDEEGSGDYDGEEEPKRGEEEDEDVRSESDAELMDEAFIASIMIGNSGITTREGKQRDQALRSTEWTAALSSDLEADAVAYPGLGEELALPVAELRDAGDAAFDHKMGAAAVVRNLNVVFVAKERYQWHTVVIDRYNSSVLLAIELLSMDVYVIGTIMLNRLGYDERIKNKRKSRPASIPRSTFTFSRSVANQLLQLKAQDFIGVVATPTVATQKRKRTQTRHMHAPEQSEDRVTKSFTTSYFCERCSVDDAKRWLCNKIRREYKGAAKTCFEIWHDDFDAGEAIPTHLGKRVVMRRPGQKAGARKKTRRELQLRADASDDGSESDNEEDSDDA
ncbi:hypothetical protein BBJ28_00007564 [Nothophytophthora sp. Chile5]|nr:hypothetical protein BBJ28_00007564 [Nothophytophthora sp. Chile5]